MKAPERFTRELDTLLADIAFSGIKNIHPGALDKTGSLAAAAKELGMAQGEKLLAEFEEALRAFRLAAESAKPEDSKNVISRLCRRDFYNKNLMGNIGGA
ncbi:MAG: hypothetical protein LBT68_00835 [Spirochaetales bacterium]|jgi:hypothetical protein|nr:hypothetical protein [Spirochaetales bacterium]